MPENADTKTVIDNLVNGLRGIPDPLDQAIAAGILMESFKQATAEIKDIRIEAVQTLNAIGWAYQKIAEAMGISKPRVQQLLNAPDVPRRPGILEQRTRVLAAEMRAKGTANDKGIAKAAVEHVRGSRGGANWSTAQIAEWAEVDEDLVLAADAIYESASPE